MSVGINRCESPLERSLAIAFSKLSRWEWREEAHNYLEVGRWPGWFMALLSQVSYGQYRADFTIGSLLRDANGMMPWVLVVEVDGHDFHERTKKQARRDKQRDRFMTRTGAKVLRFTGSEVHADALACASEAFELAMALQGPALDASFEAFLERKQSA